MKLLFRILLAFTCLFPLAYKNVQAQQNLVYSHYFLNPFLYNPSFVAPNGYTELYLNYRNQWAGVEGAPTTGTVSIHLPLNYKAGIAFTGYQDKAGVLKTTTGLLTFAYQVYLGDRISDDHKIGFGLSAGMMSISIDPEDVDTSDPVVGTTSSFEGQFGIHYQLKNFKIAFAIPRLFRTYVASEQDLNKFGIEQIRTTITSVSYNIKLNDRFEFEPIATYRTYENTDGQYEGLGVLRMDNLVWIGGSYRQDYGATAFLGFNVKDKLKLGYAYEFATDQVNAFGDGTHELQLVVRLGKKKASRSESKGKAQIKQPLVEDNAGESEIPNEDRGKEDEAVAASTKESQDEETGQHEIVKQSGQLPKPAEDKDIPVDNKSTVNNKNIAGGNKDIPRNSKNVAADNKTIADAQNKKSEPVQSLSGNGLLPGHYVVVGAFHSVENAKSYARTLKRAGYPADVAYQPEKSYYIVHMTNAPTLEEAQQLRSKYRQMSRYSFRDTWVLSIE